MGWLWEARFQRGPYLFLHHKLQAWVCRGSSGSLWDEVGKLSHTTACQTVSSEAFFWTGFFSFVCWLLLPSSPFLLLPPPFLLLAPSPSSFLPSSSLLLPSSAFSECKISSTPDTISYSAAVSACEKGGRWELALELLNECKTWSTPNTISYNAAISACEKGDTVFVIARSWEQTLFMASPSEMNCQHIGRGRIVD